MSDLIPPGVLDERDVRAAQAVLDAWAGTELAALSPELGAALLELRGLLAGTFSEVRAAGVLEGHRAGWAEALDAAEDAVRCALEELR